MHKYSLSILALFSLIILGSCRGFFYDSHENAKNFQVGTQVTESQYSSTNSTHPPKTTFQTPNTEWKTRTLSGITYVFGEGNPEAVMPKLSEYSLPQQDYLHDTLVRPKTEKLLKDFLSNPMLERVINNCGPLTVPDIGMASELKRTLPNSLFTTDFSLESMLVIDSTTGRKKVSWEREELLGEVLSQIQYGTPKTEPLLTKCLTGTEIADFNFLYSQFLAIGTSASNDSDENRKEVLDFLSGR